MGKVFLIGAGPGAVDLLTLRAWRALQRADVLLYDRLVDEEILQALPDHAERIDVGKYPGESSRIRQDRIHTLMIGKARAGKTVVRLKGGDPFVFGRGGEELNVLYAAGIEAEVVPGISSSIAGPAAAGIPVTYRGIAASFGVFTGHAGEDVPAGWGIDWTAAARIHTAVFLMGVKNLPEISASLIEHGRDPRTPVALVERATTKRQRNVVGTLADIARIAEAEKVRSPAVIVVGEVVDAVRTADLAMAGAV